MEGEVIFKSRDWDRLAKFRSWEGRESGGSSKLAEPAESRGVGVGSASVSTGCGIWVL